uniref:Exonuclease n=1 Tax=viral metagenome TaxID=1070528 RepID=A0A6M3JPL2_9ZZZZ
MSIIVVDIEADGPVPGIYSMTEIGAVLVKEPLDVTFYGTLSPISKMFQQKALAVTGRTRPDTLQFDDPKKTMERFKQWLDENCTPPYIFLSDNNGFDFAFASYYFHLYLSHNPFGYSSRNLNDLFKGIQRDMRASFKGLRKTPHDHNPVNDAKGNAEALLEMIKLYDLKGFDKYM